MLPSIMRSAGLALCLCALSLPLAVAQYSAEAAQTRALQDANTTPSNLKKQQTLPVSQTLASLPSSSENISGSNELPGAAAPITAQASKYHLLESAAAGYGTYHYDVSDIHARGLNSAKDVSDALDRLAGRNPEQLSRGWVAYAALVAAQSPELQASVQDVVQYYGREIISKGLIKDRNYVRRDLKGAETALIRAQIAISADTRRLEQTARFFRRQAYALQISRWARARIRGKTMTLVVDKLIAAATTPRDIHQPIFEAFIAPDIDQNLQAAGQAENASFWDTVLGIDTDILMPNFPIAIAESLPEGIQKNTERAANQIATLAAFHIMGIGADNIDYASAALGDGPLRACTAMAQLNINQCAHSNSSPFETVDCIGKHAIQETTACFDQIVD